MKPSKLVLGTVQFGMNYGINNLSGQPDMATVSEILDWAFSRGIQELDTADGYGTASQVLKAYLEKSRKPFAIMSKFSWTKDQQFLDILETTLQGLGQASIKGYYFHRFPDFLEFNQFDQVAKAKSQGLIKKLGVSLYSNADLEIAISNSHVDIIQVPFNILDRDPVKQDLLKKAHKSGKAIYVRSAFLQGLFFKSIENFPPRLKSLALVVAEIQNIATQHFCSVQDLCLQYIANKSFVDKIVVGVDNLPQLISNCESISASIESEQLASIEKLVEQISIPDVSLLNPANWK